MPQHLDHFPQRKNASGTLQTSSFPGEDKESQASVASRINAAEYDVGAQDPSFERVPQPDDPHRKVPRFADALPSRIHTPPFQAKLRRKFPPGDFEKAQLRFAVVLAYVYKKLRKWYPEAMMDLTGTAN